MMMDSTAGEQFRQQKNAQGAMTVFAGTTWDDSTGYYHVNVTPFSCTSGGNGVVTSGLVTSGKNGKMPQ